MGTRTTAQDRQFAAEAPAERLSAVELIAYVRWAGVVLGILQAFTVTDPAPIGGPWFVLMTAGIMAAYNVPATLARRLSPRTVEVLRLGCLFGDFLVCTAWTMLVANDIYSTAYAIYILVGVEAAFLYGVRGAAGFSVAFLAAYIALYWERAAFFGFPVLVSSIMFRSAIVLIAVGFAGAITEQSRRRRAAALAAGAEARHQANLAARRTDELDSLLRAISDMGEGVVTIRDGRIVDANEAFCHISGYERATLLRFRSFLDVVAPEAREPLTDRTRLEQPPGASGETLLLTRDGEQVPVDWTTRNMQVDGRTQVVAVVRDIRGRRRIMELIEAERDRAAEASRAKTEYLSRMSHELRTPMTVILGFADLIKLHAPDEENQAVDSILRAGSHLLSLINDALDISRIESGKELLTLAPVRLDTVIEESAQLMRPLAEARNTTLEVSVAEGVAEHVQADRQRLAQVMLNLLSNAVKYAEVGSSVKLRVTMAGRRRVCVSVADNGPGIAPDKLPLVFEPFERLGAERSATPGTGLGLALTKRLVDAMGGAIGVESALGSGTTFWVELNVADRAPDTTSEPQAVASAGAVAAAAEETVLYVEDNVATIQLVSEIFTLRPSIRLLTAMQGSLAFELALQHQPRMIIIDVHLPDMDGFELLQRFKADTRTRDVPVVVLSADATQWQRDRLLGGGASQYLTKPVSVSELLEVVDATIGAAQAEGAAAGAAAEGSPAAV